MSDDRHASVQGRETATAPTTAPAAGGRRRTAGRSRKPVFDKDHATLWLLTLSLGFGIGAVLRVAQTSGANATGSQLAVQRAQLPSQSGSSAAATFPSRGVTVLPQRTYRTYGTTRMS